MSAKYAVTARATNGLDRIRPSATATATARLAISDTEDDTTPNITWSTDPRIVRSVSAEFRSTRMRCGARACPRSSREIRSASAAFAAPTFSHRTNTESRLRATNSAAVIESRTSATR
jgi:hypothetical protein